MILAFEIGLIVIGCLVVFGLMEYRANTNADIANADARQLERDLLVRHLKEVNPK